MIGYIIILNVDIILFIIFLKVPITFVNYKNRYFLPSFFHLNLNKNSIIYKKQTNNSGRRENWLPFFLSFLLSFLSLSSSFSFFLSSSFSFFYYLLLSFFFFLLSSFFFFLFPVLLLSVSIMYSGVSVEMIIQEGKEEGRVFFLSFFINAISILLLFNTILISINK